MPSKTLRSSYRDISARHQLVAIVEIQLAISFIHITAYPECIVYTYFEILRKNAYTKTWRPSVSWSMDEIYELLPKPSMPKMMKKRTKTDNAVWSIVRVLKLKSCLFIETSDKRCRTNVFIIIVRMGMVTISLKGVRDNFLINENTLNFYWAISPSIMHFRPQQVIRFY